MANGQPHVVVVGGDNFFGGGLTRAQILGPDRVEISSTQYIDARTLVVTFTAHTPGNYQFVLDTSN